MKFEIYAFEQVAKKGKIKSQQLSNGVDGNNNDNEVAKIDEQPKPEVTKLIMVEEYFDQNKGEKTSEKTNNETNKLIETSEKDKHKSKDKEDLKKNDKNGCVIY